MITIKYDDNEKVHPDTFKFSAGEIQVKVPFAWSNPKEVQITARIKGSNGIMELLLVNDALIRMYGHGISRTLILPYLPYSRQDRVMNPGEALSSKVFAELINNMFLDKVTTWDAHSDVGVALIDNCESLDQAYLLDTFSDYRETYNIYDELCNGNITLISPDAGAVKKTLKVAQHYGGLEVIQASKIRDTKTGKIVRTELNASFVIGGKDLLIVDDICDGGMTFIKLAEQLNKYHPKSISLYVTHGIFSKGYQVLFKAGIKRIFTTNSFEQTYEVQGLKVTDL